MARRVRLARAARERGGGRVPPLRARDRLEPLLRRGDRRARGPRVGRASAGSSSASTTSARHCSPPRSCCSAASWSRPPAPRALALARHRARPPPGGLDRGLDVRARAGAGSHRGVTLVEELAAATIGATFNFYRDGEGAELRCARLAAYLERRQRRAAPARRRGARLPRHARERRPADLGAAQLDGTRPRRGDRDDRPPRARASSGSPTRVLLWNVVPTHPHLPGTPETRTVDRRAPRSRRPGPSWLRLARVGGSSRSADSRTRSSAATYVRHPSHGGATEFREGLRRIVRRSI